MLVSHRRLGRCCAACICRATSWLPAPSPLLCACTILSQLQPSLHELVACLSQPLLPCLLAVWCLLTADDGSAQADQGAGAQRLVRPPSEPPRLPYTPTCTRQRALWGALVDSVAHVALFVNHPWLLPESPFKRIVAVDGFPSENVGMARTALFQEVMAMTSHCNDSQLGCE